MKGLLLKDFCLIRNNQKMYLVILLIAMLLLLTGNEPIFVVSYMTVIFSMSTLTTISYDEFDKSSAFLLTMPITRTLYVKEKYLFGLLSTGFGWFFSILCAFGFALITKWNGDLKENLFFCIASLIIGLMMLILLIPIQLKFGGDNGKIVLISCIGGIVLLAVLVKKGADYLGIDLTAITAQWIAGLSGFVLAGMIVIVMLALWMLSYGVSRRVVMRREY